MFLDNTSENYMAQYFRNTCAPSAASLRDTRLEIPCKSRMCRLSTLSAPYHSSAMVHATLICDMFAASSQANTSAARNRFSQFGNIAWYTPCTSGESGE